MLKLRLLSLFLWAPAIAGAQDISSALSGAIVDPANAAISDVQVVLTQTLHVGRLGSLQPPLLVEDVHAREPGDTDDINVEVSGNNVAYIYYTSGSTGKPKGVVLDHLGVMNRLGWLRRKYVLHEGERSILKTPLIFDLAIWEIFGPLMAGSTILMADARAESDVAHISDLLSRPRTVFVYFVPSMLESFLNFAPRRAYPDYDGWP